MYPRGTCFFSLRPIPVYRHTEYINFEPFVFSNQPYVVMGRPLRCRRCHFRRRRHICCRYCRLNQSSNDFNGRLTG